MTNSFSGPKTSSLKATSCHRECVVRFTSSHNLSVLLPSTLSHHGAGFSLSLPYSMYYIGTPHSYNCRLCVAGMSPLTFLLRIINRLPAQPNWGRFTLTRAGIFASLELISLASENTWKGHKKNVAALQAETHGPLAGLTKLPKKAYARLSRLKVQGVIIDTVRDSLVRIWFRETEPCAWTCASVVVIPYLEIIPRRYSKLNPYSIHSFP